VPSGAVAGGQVLCHGKRRVERVGECGDEERVMTGPEAMTKYSRDDNIITTTTQARV
jgi:hypothetical protein